MQALLEEVACNFNVHSQLQNMAQCTNLIHLWDIFHKGILLSLSLEKERDRGEFCFGQFLLSDWVPLYCHLLIVILQGVFFPPNKENLQSSPKIAKIPTKKVKVQVSARQTLISSAKFQQKVMV